MKVPTDHQDMVATLMQLISNITKRELPSARNGRNLFQIADNLMNGERLYKHVSFRSTSVFSEVATEDKLFRFSSYGY